MFYWGGTDESVDPRPHHRGIRRADSPDLAVWTRGGRAPGGRDPMVLQAGGQWLLYSVGNSADNHGQILVSDSTDLVSWSEPVVVITDPEAMPWDFTWGNLESPFVVQRAGHYYLFLTRTSPRGSDYVRTQVFRSQDPRHFAWRPINDLYAHAAEVIEDGGRWYLTSAGWPSALGEARRGLSIAPLGWAGE
jgi:beta-fructofuranosidase